MRITHTLPLNERVRLLVFGEVFNLFNTANLVQYSGNLLEHSTFGQLLWSVPTERVASESNA